MKNSRDAAKFLKKTLGDDALVLFETQMEDLICYAKALSLTDFKSSPPEARKKMDKISCGILIEAVGAYLRAHHSDDNGMIDVNVDDEGQIVYDKDMRKIRPLKDLQEKQAKVIGVMVDEAMSRFMRTRLALKVVTRKRDIPRSKAPSRKPGIMPVSERNYNRSPPREQVEVEIMRLERKLPNISTEEGLRLSKLYQHS